MRRMNPTLHPVVQKSSPFLLRYVPKEQRVPDDIASPHAARLFQEPVKPLQRMALPPKRGATDGAGKEVEHRAHRAAMATDVQLVPMRVGPLLLLRGRHAHPEQVGVGPVDGVDEQFDLGYLFQVPLAFHNL